MQFRCFSTFQACRRKFSRFSPIWIYTCSAALDTHRGDPGCPGLWVALSVQRERTAAVQSHLIDFITSFGIIYGCDKGSECKGKVKHIHFFHHHHPQQSSGFVNRGESCSCLQLAKLDLRFGGVLVDGFGNAWDETTTRGINIYSWTDAHRIQTYLIGKKVNEIKWKL